MIHHQINSNRCLIRLIDRLEAEIEKKLNTNHKALWRIIIMDNKFHIS